MYPGRSSWARGVLALGAGSLLLLALQWRIEEIRAEDGTSTRSERNLANDEDGRTITARSTGTEHFFHFLLRDASVRVTKSEEEKEEEEEEENRKRNRRDTRPSWFSSPSDRSIDEDEDRKRIDGSFASGVASKDEKNHERTFNKDDNDVPLVTSSIGRKIEDDTSILAEEDAEAILRSSAQSLDAYRKDTRLEEDRERFDGTRKDRILFFRRNLEKHRDNNGDDDFRDVSDQKNSSLDFSGKESQNESKDLTIRKSANAKLQENPQKLLEVRLSHSFSLDRRKRYTNYYSLQSATPMAYVHIQPTYPVAPPPPPNRKCIRCMVVYKPCPSPPRQPPRIVLPTYKYQEPASRWHGLKYGESLRDTWGRIYDRIDHDFNRFFT
ncbi:hypothetical protein KPH14_004715 [Odynerus spinipes]|uniref:Uncharacterized protein n=1 Tax=Odynerus spinipes TaxID=1348599 RepID=A0AAD9RMI0_9HYME|nr:hypothetical protein KPH14_004715 [Odynerus spinipes]